MINQNRFGTYLYVCVYSHDLLEVGNMYIALSSFLVSPHGCLLAIGLVLAVHRQCTAGEEERRAVRLMHLML